MIKNVDKFKFDGNIKIDNIYDENIEGEGMVTMRNTGVGSGKLSFNTAMKRYEWYHSSNNYKLLVPGELELPANQRFGQGFTIGTVSPNIDQTIKRVRMNVIGAGKGIYFSTGIACDIYEVDDDFYPSGPILSQGTCTDVKLSENTPDPLNWININMSPYVLESDTQYVAVFRTDQGQDALDIGVDTVTPYAEAYLGGPLIYSYDDGQTWGTHDWGFGAELWFEIWSVPYPVNGSLHTGSMIFKVKDPLD